MDTVITAQQPQVRNSGQVIKPLVTNYARIGSYKIRVVQRNFNNLGIAGGIQRREKQNAFFLCYALSHPYNEQGFTFIAKNAGVEQANDLQALTAWPQVFR